MKLLANLDKKMKIAYTFRYHLKDSMASTIIDQKIIIKGLALTLKNVLVQFSSSLVLIS